VPYPLPLVFFPLLFLPLQVQLQVRTGGRFVLDSFVKSLACFEPDIQHFVYARPGGGACRRIYWTMRPWLDELTTGTAP
jgi:hypothetical protein